MPLRGFNMLRLITGLPGHNKTSNTLAAFLEIKDRPKFATFINGFDYDKHGVTKLEHLQDIFTLPPKSLVFCDEAQKFLRPRPKSEPVAPWVAEFETHRHLGIDLWYTTQHPMLIDVHVRRLTEEHWHYFRPKGIQRLTTVRIWDAVRENPNDYHAKQEAEIKSAVPPAWVFKEYTSTVEDTNKARFPRKLIYAGLAILAAVIFVIYSGMKFFDRNSPDEVQAVPAATPAAPARSSSSGMVAGSGERKALTLDDFRPVHPMLPWTAPVYASNARMVAVPRFAGCMASRKGCSCVTQQGTYLEVERDLCIGVVYGRSMPFDPFHPDSETPPPRSVAQAAPPPQEIAAVTQEQPSTSEFEPPYP